jgi:2-methylcitrate dehydratase PrpD
MSATSDLAGYAASTRYGDLPPEVVAQARLAILDSVGCLLGGSTLPAARQLRGIMMGMAAEGAATVAGEKRRVPSAIASYLNAQQSNILDFDDTFETGALGHPAATIIPPALAVAEEVGASGEALLTAVVVGYDVYARIGMACRPSVERSRQVRGLAPWQIFGTAAAVAHILGLSTEAMARAFGLAALHAPVPSVGKIYEERPMWSLKNNYGWTAMGGVLGAQYAEGGLHANHSILDGDTGFWVMAGSDRCDFSLLTRGLGQHYSILDTSFKPYPSCRHTHSTLDAIRQIMQRGNFEAGQVRRVRVRSCDKIKAFADYRPQSYMDAQFSLPYVVAMLLLREPVGQGWVEGEKWQNARVLEVADRVLIEVDPDAEAEFARGNIRSHVTIQFEEGHEEEAEVTYPLGHPVNPMTEGDILAKFRGLVDPVLGSEDSRRLASMLVEIDGLRDLSQVMTNLGTDTNTDRGD